jgi:beta-mannosidase
MTDLVLSKGKPLVNEDFLIICLNSAQTFSSSHQMIISQKIVTHHQDSRTIHFPDATHLYPHQLQHQKSCRMKIPKEKNLFALSAVTSILSAVATTPTTASLQSYDLTSASLQWKLENCDGKISIPAKIPGLVHTDLLSAGFVKENPYYRFNELEQSWISKETCWKYSASFPLEALLDDVPLFLELSGVDTIANITLNNYFLGSTSNAFKTYSYEVQTQYLTGGMNELVLTIDSPVSYPQEKADQYPYSVPHTQNYNVWTEPSDRNFIRKAGSDFGWDWGPAYVPSGVTGSISMYQSTMGKFSNLLILQDLSEDFAEVTLTPKLQLQHVSPSAISATVLVYLDNQLIQQSDYDLHSGQKVLQLNSLEITKPTLWYPVGFGSPHLYEFTVKYCPSTAASTAFSTSDCQTQTKKIGIRKMELIREKIGTLNSAKFSHQNSTRDGQYQARSLETAAPSPEMAADDLRLYQVEPQTFYFKINGQPIFARGANFIPIDSFQSRVTKADR